MNKIDLNALPPVREPGDRDVAGGFESLADGARAAATSADIDYAAPELASRASEHDDAAGDAAFSINREVHHATLHGAAHHARHADSSQITRHYSLVRAERSDVDRLAPFEAWHGTNAHRPRLFSRGMLRNNRMQDGTHG